jgi:NhaA family Na+:H+ antiporter
VFFILPVFAFANAGVHVEWSEIAHTLREPVTMGAGLGLVLGKPIGILLASWLMVQTGLAELPRGVRWTHIIGVGFLAGIGFTMSLFINELAFVHSDPETAERLMMDGKIGILVGSITSAIIGLVWLWIASRNDERPAPAPAAH